MQDMGVLPNALVYEKTLGTLTEKKDFFLKKNHALLENVACRLNGIPAIS